MRKMLIAAGAAFAVVSTAAYASVAFDESTGTGFVGKGDVQVLYGWNNAAAQRNIPALTFNYVAEESWGYDCEFYTGPTQNRTRHEVSHKKTTSVNASVAYDTRKNNQGQITGINLNGFGTTTTTGGTVPTIGASCPGNPGNGAVVIAVDSAPTSSSGGLTVTYGGVTFPLPNTPIIVPII
jgi:hypothetical protein